MEIQEKFYYKKEVEQLRYTNRGERIGRPGLAMIPKNTMATVTSLNIMQKFTNYLSYFCNSNILYCGSKLHPITDFCF